MLRPATASSLGRMDPSASKSRFPIPIPPPSAALPPRQRPRRGSPSIRPASRRTPRTMSGSADRVPAAVRQPAGKDCSAALPGVRDGLQDELPLRAAGTRPAQTAEEGRKKAPATGAQGPTRRDSDARTPNPTPQPGSPTARAPPEKEDL